MSTDESILDKVKDAAHSALDAVEHGFDNLVGITPKEENKEPEANDPKQPEPEAKEKNANDEKKPTEPANEAKEEPAPKNSGHQEDFFIMYKKP